MNKAPVAELEGAQLDWAVAKANGLAIEWDDELRCWSSDEGHEVTGRYDPSSSWAIAGKIIERERIALTCGAGFRSDTSWGFVWEAQLGFAWCQGDTPLIAAMRCFVASKLGYEAEVPV